MGTVSIGQRVNVRGEPGTVRYVGQTQFAPGEWIGVELDHPRGRNDGSVQGVKYFECHGPGSPGVFVRPELIDQKVLERSGSSAGPDAKVIVAKLQVKLKASVEEISKSKETIFSLSQELDHNKRLREELEQSVDQQAVESEYLQASNAELQQSLESLREKYDHLFADFSIVNEELEIHKELEKAVGLSSVEGPVAIEDFQVLLQHSKKLELAVHSLRTASEEADESRQETLKLLEAKTNAFVALEKSHSSLEEKLKDSESAIARLHEELEMSAESSSIIDFLTSENEALQAKVGELTQSAKELTELHEMDKSIEENHIVVEKEFHEVVSMLRREIEDHSKQLDHFKTENTSLLRESSDLKKRLLSESPLVNSQEMEQLILQSKKLKLEASKSKFASAALQNESSILEHFSERLVPPTYKEQVSTISMIHKSISSCSVLLADIQKHQFSSLRCKASYDLKSLISVLHFFRGISENVNWAAGDQGDSLQNHISQLQSELKHLLSQYAPGDMFSLDFSSVLKSTEFVSNICASRNVPLLVKSYYSHSCMRAEIESSLDVARHLLSVLCDEPSFSGPYSELASFVSQVEDIVVPLSSKLKTLEENADSELSNDSPPLPECGGLFTDFFKFMRELESEVELDRTDIVEMWQQSSVISEEKSRFVTEVIGQLQTNFLFENRAYRTIYEDLTESTVSTTSEDQKATSEMESQLLQKAQQIQDLYLQVELSEKHMISSLAGKEKELKEITDLLSEVKEECSKLKIESEDLLSANKELSEQLEALRSADHIAEYQQIPVFETLKEMKDYTNTMALVDEINLLKNMIRVKSSSASSRSLADDWLDIPLKRRKHIKRASQGLEVLQLAQKKRKEALLLSQAILAKSIK